MYPNNSQYKVAIQNAYYHTEKNGGLKYDAIIRNGEPIFEPGNRAVVYKTTNPITNTITALKLFFGEIQQRTERFQSISNFITLSKNNYFVEFRYVENLIYVEVNSNKEENYFPGLIMDWVEGATLGSKVKEYCINNDRKGLNLLCEKFKDLSIFLLNSEIAHGDLKHDNIIVDKAGNLKLIDYDGLFVPFFIGQKSSELGTPSFQHPNRTGVDYNKNIDDFSIITIYVSLLALSKDPSLFEQFNDQQNLLFSTEDFESPKSSPLFTLLRKNKETERFIYIIEKSLSRQSIEIDRLLEFLNNNFPRPSIKVSHTPTDILIGDEVTLNWESYDTEFITHHGKEIELNGTLKQKVQRNNNIRFILNTPFENIEVDYKLNALPHPQISVFRSKHQKIEYNKTTQLVWDVEHAKNVELHYGGKMEIVGLKDLKTINPTEHTNYKLIVTALDGITKTEKETTIQVFKQIEIKSFQSNLEFVVESLSIKLSWEIENASSVILSSNTQGDIDVTGKNEFVVKPKKACVFYLKANNDLFNKTSEEIKITVQLLPKIIIDIPSVMELIPSFNLNFKELSNGILAKSQLDFEEVMQPKRNFSLLNTLNYFLK